jgi:hypothetical protein
MTASSTDPTFIPAGLSTREGFRLFDRLLSTQQQQKADYTNYYSEPPTVLDLTEHVQCESYPTDANENAEIRAVVGWTRWKARNEVRLVGAC